MMTLCTLYTEILKKQHLAEVANLKKDINTQFIEESSNKNRVVQQVKKGETQHSLDQIEEHC